MSDNFASKLARALELDPNNKFLQKAYASFSETGNLDPKKRIAASRIFRQMNLEGSRRLSLKEVFMVKEISKEESENYYQDILRRNPELHAQLERVARFALLASRSKKGPADVASTMRVLFNKNTDIDPLQSGDTMGVEMYIDHLSGEDTESAGKAKRFYNNVFNALLKNRYGS